jgi:hypothetical protein
VSFEYTAKGRYYKTFLDGIEQTKHTTEREAIESANRIKEEHPDSDVRYTVEVGLVLAGGGGVGSRASSAYDPSQYSSYTQRYVDLDSGSDLNGGTTYADGWATISHAVTQISAGTVINVRGTSGSTYNQGNGSGANYQQVGGIEPTVSGTANNYCVIQPEAGFERAFTIQGGNYVWSSEGQDYWVIRGMKFQSNADWASDSDEGCITVDQGSTNLIFEYNEFLGRDVGVGNDNHAAIAFYGGGNSDIVIRHNKVHGTKSTGPLRSAGMRFYGCTNLDIYNNEIYDCTFGVDFKGSNTNVNCYNNYIHDVTRGSFILAHQGGATLTNADIYQNVIDTNTESSEGSGCFVVHAPQDAYSDVRFFNNSVYNMWRITYVENSSPSDTLEMFNNIFEMRDTRTYTSYSLSVAEALADITFWDYNCYVPSNQTHYISDGFKETEWDAQNDINSIDADPLYTDEAAGDFTLQSGSPCLGAGQDRAQLLGGLATASINMGAYITANQTETVGVDW